MIFRIRSSGTRVRTASRSAPGTCCSRPQAVRKAVYNGYYYFSGAETAQVVNGSPQAVTTGNSYASFLLGLVNSANMQQLDITRSLTAESWHLRRGPMAGEQNLSVNFGLRWDIEPPAV